MANFISIDELTQNLEIGPEGNSRFMLLLGAGASASSGIPTGGQLISNWRESFNEKAEQGKGVEHQDWHGKPSEYGRLFEFHFKTPASRREFIESCVEGAQPAWGYLYLADLLDKGFFNVILTLNFDDLVNEACHAFTASLRPLVCAHDSSIHLFRLTGIRPKVIKLHGDYLYDDIKNTPPEVASLNENTKSKLEWLSNEYGLLSIGYSGGDESIMSVIADRLQKSEAFPNGVFWCVSDKSSIPARLQPHEDNPRLFFILCSDFDALMAKIHEAVVGQSPPIVSDFSKAMADRVSHLVTGLVPDTLGGDEIPTVQRDINVLAEAISQDGEDGTSNIAVHLPFGFLGVCHFLKERYQIAAQYFRKDILNSPQTSTASLIFFFECLRRDWNPEAFDQVFARIEESLNIPDNAFAWLCSATVSMIHARKFDAANRLVDLAEKALAISPERDALYATFNIINRAQIVLHNSGALDDEQEREIRSIVESTQDLSAKFGCLILLDRSKEAADLVVQHPQEFSANVSDWPIIDLMSAPQKNAVLKVLGDGVPHYHGLKVEFKMHVHDTAAQE